MALQSTICSRAQSLKRLTGHCKGFRDTVAAYEWKLDKSDHERSKVMRALRG